ncbi:MAG: N-acetylmuramoyl-L-alanine amidase [Lachnospiraceae bacterium]|nr:N-acetylmuramoyl-L-alanine amidase [Lachnospiraceae bacterium]
MKIKRILIYALFVILLLFCVGCGKKDNKTAVTDETSESVRQDVHIDNMQVDSETNESPDITVDEAGFTVTDDYVKTSGMTVNVRVSPSTDATIYQMLEDGVVLKRTGYNDQWTRVKIDGTDFYIHSDYVVETEPPEEPIVDEKIDIASPSDAASEKVKRVVIDPGNQANPNAAQEQIGPGSEETKQGISSGKVGVAYGTKEYELNLVYANLLKAELEKRGYEVILTRDSNNVDLTNKQRAEFANQSGATVFIRIQMNYSSNDDLTGVMALCMSEASQYNAELYTESYALSTRLLQGITESTNAINHGIYETNEMTCINWSEIPVAVIKLGFLSNAGEEANLVSDEYKNKLVQGIANGIDYYFEQ